MGTGFSFQNISTKILSSCCIKTNIVHLKKTTSDIEITSIPNNLEHSKYIENV